MQESEPGTRRIAERLPTNFPAVVVIPGRPPINCTVRDMSEDGALLEFRASIWLPPRFHVRISAMETEAFCEVRHQRSNRAGVKFVRVSVSRTGPAAPEVPSFPTLPLPQRPAMVEIEQAPADVEDMDFAAAEPPPPPPPAPKSRQPAPRTETMRDRVMSAEPARPAGRTGAAIRSSVSVAKPVAPRVISPGLPVSAPAVPAQSKSLLGRLFNRG